jgi:AcrR family transcriptional regulator
MDQIAQEADIGKGTIYTHFHAKDELLAEIASRFNEELTTRIRARDRSGSAVERLHELLVEVLESHLADSGYHIVLGYCSHSEFHRRLEEGTRKRLEESEAQLIDLIRPERGRETRSFSTAPGRGVSSPGASDSIWGDTQHLARGDQ